MSGIATHRRTLLGILASTCTSLVQIAKYIVSEDRSSGPHYFNEHLRKYLSSILVSFSISLLNSLPPIFESETFVDDPLA